MNRHSFIKSIVFILLLSLFAVVISTFRDDFYPQKEISEYYSILQNKSKVLSTEVITAEELDSLEDCKDNYLCFKKYFYDYNASTTLEKSFSNLSLLLLQKPEYVYYCHQITHGIGNSELDKQNGDLGKALELFNTGKYFTNIASCGSGYFHGLVEEAVKDITDKDELVQKFTNICNLDTVKKIAGSDCIHGLGHATYIQTNYNLDDSLYVCDKVTNTEYDKFNCYAGIFMEATISLPQVSLIEKIGDNLDFKMCDLTSNDLQKRACYYETSLAMRDFLQDKTDYSELMGMCSKIPSDLYRMGCIKNVSFRSIADVSYADLHKLCFESGLNENERIMCVAVFAHRLALSITATKNQDYYDMTGDMCKILSIRDQYKCNALIINTPSQLYLVTEKDI